MNTKTTPLKQFGFTKYFDLLRQVIILIDRDGTLNFINRRGAEVLQYSRKDITGKNWFEQMIEADKRDLFTELFNAAVSSRQVEDNFENVIVCGDGSKKTILWHTTLLKDDTGEITGLLCSGEDVTEQRNNETKLAESENNYRALVENIYQVVFSVDFTDDLWKTFPRFVNEHIKDLTGFSAKDFQSGNIVFQDRVHPGDQEVTSKIFLQMIKTKQPVNRIYSFRHKNGKYKWFEDTLIPKIDETGKVTGCFGVLSEITEKKAAQEAIADYENFFSLSRDMFCLANTDSFFVKVNHSFQRVLGYTEEELMERSFIEFVHPDDVEKTKREVSHLKNGQLTVNFENRYRCKDGSYKWLSWTSSPPGSNGYIYAVARDITSQKKAEELLKENEQRLSEAHKIAQVGSWEFDVETEKITWTEETFRLFGLNPNEKKIITREEFRALIHPDDQALLASLVEGAVKEKKSYESEIRVVWPDGATHYLIGRGRPVIKDGKTVKLIGTGMDITDRRLSEMREMKAIVTGQDMERKRVAEDLHDSLGQKLSAMRLYVENLKSEPGFTNSKKVEELEGLLDETIQEIRNISHNLMPAALGDFGVENALEQLCERLNKPNGPHITFQSFEVRQQIDVSIEFGLYRITQELLNNAIKHAKADEISVQLFERENMLLLTVEDDGIGFEPKKINFENTFGLNSVASRAKAMNGFFDIDSHPGKGTLATVEIPL